MKGKNTGEGKAGGCGGGHRKRRGTRRERDREHYHLGRASGVRKKTKEWEREKKVHGQIHLPLLQSISGQKKYTITRQEEAKINGPPTSPLTSIHLHPIPPLSPSLSLSHALFLSSACLSHPIPLSPLTLLLSLSQKSPILFFFFHAHPPFPPPPPPPTHTLSLPHAVIDRFC